MIIVYILLAVIAAYLVFLCCCALAVSPDREYKTHSRFYRRVLNDATSIALRLCRVKIHVTGMDKLPAEGRMLFVCNHRSNFDPLVTWHVLKKWDIAFISKPENFNIPIFGRIARRCCFLAIDRENPRNAYKTIERAVELIKSDQVSVGVYPEGTRNTKSDLLPFHNGVFKIAQRTGVPIAVLTIAGTDMVHRNFPFRRTHIYLNVVDVIPPAEQSKNTAEIGHRVTSAMLLTLAAANQ
ncbi:MAG: lysophospholipid acyltransferase family protein [Oscillospiraceae bacterium]